MTTNWVAKATILLTLFSPTTSWANEITIGQIGDDFTLTIVQDGQDNSISGTTNTPVTGDSNSLSFTQNGNYMNFEGALTGNNNSLTSFQGGGADNSFIRGTLIGNSNTIDLRQGKKIDGSIDGSDSGNFEQYVTVVGDDNNVITSQVNSGGTGSGHHMAHIIDGDSNSLSHLQYADGKKNGFIEITGDNNDVTLEQRNDATHFTDIVLTGNDHTVYGEQRGGMYGAHSMTMDLTNNGGAYDISTTQNSANAQTYSLTGSCANTNGCSVVVTQN